MPSNAASSDGVNSKRQAASVASSSSPKKKKPPTKHTPGSGSGSGKKTTKQPPRPVVPVVVSATNGDSQQRKKQRNNNDDDDDETRRKMSLLCFGICCCLLILLIVGLVLGLVVFKNDDNDNNGSDGPGQLSNPNTNPNTNNGNSNPSGSPLDNGGAGNGVPTQPSVPSSPFAGGVPMPTRAPSPTIAPTPKPPTTPPPVPAPVVTPTSLLQPTPTQLIILPFADTLVFRDGFDEFEAYGEDDTFLVQNGPIAVNEIPDSIGLIAFDLDNTIADIPASATQVVLQLYHQAATRNRGAATLTIRRLPSTRLFIESFHGGLFNPDDDEGIVGPTFDVSPDDGIVQVDLSNLVLSNSNNIGDDVDQLFLMIENQGPEQFEEGEGDRFYTRETNDPPQLIVSF